MSAQLQTNQSQLSDRFLRLPEVLELIGIKKSTAWAWAREGRIPKGIHLGARVTVWRQKEILAWLAAQGQRKEPKRLLSGR